MSKLIFSIWVVMTLNACAPMFVQSPGDGLSPINAVSEGDDKHLMLFGYDVVNYFTDNTHAKGSPENKSVYKSVSFWFTSPEHKVLFDQNPDKYIPQYGGYCSNGIVYGIPWGGNADTWMIQNGKLYIFGGQSSKDAFMLEPAKNLELADKYWNEEVNGANAFWQRMKRMIFRVPHYKSGKELAAEVTAANSKN